MPESRVKAQQKKGEQYTMSSAAITTKELIEAVEQLSLPDLEQFVSEVLRLQAQRHAPNQEKQSRQEADLEINFYKLVEQWRGETRGLSSTDRISMHPAYQQIIGMGREVIPLLLRELEQNSGRWFWALKSITREDPVNPEQQGKTKEMVEAWLNWGKKKGYKW